MARRFGWGSNGGVSVGDVKAALGGRAFGEQSTGATALDSSATGFTPDCSQGETFYLTLATATSGRTVTINNPTNYADGSRVRLIIVAAGSGATFTFGSLYRNAAFTNLASAGKYDLMEFDYVPSQGTFVQTRVAKGVSNA